MFTTQTLLKTRKSIGRKNKFFTFVQLTHRIPMNQETSERQKAIQDQTPKKKLSEQLTPIQAWDAVAIRLVKGELAPNGYEEVKSGPYKGRIKAKSALTFLQKGSVVQVQNYACSLVRTFRTQAQASLTRQIDTAKGNASKLKWYQFREKWAYKGIIEALEGTMKELDNIEVPR
jgi:hypothetical protein